MKKIKMRWYSFSSNKSQLIVSRIIALSQSHYRLCSWGGWGGQRWGRFWGLGAGPGGRSRRGSS